MIKSFTLFGFLFVLTVWSFSQMAIAQSLCLTSASSYVNGGNINVVGDKITVEALIYLHQTPTIYFNVVSKHTGVHNVNYLLRPLTFEITTYNSGTSGATSFKQMYNPYSLNVNQWYHIAATYDGSKVKYYVDGCLVIESNWSGNLVQNNHTTAIGNRSDCVCEQFFGKIDEVRIWKRVRTQNEIVDNMYTLSNPTSESGLVAYYKFDDDNKNMQGNSTFDGTKIGTTAFCNTNPKIDQFKITKINITNIECKNSKGSVEIFTNRTGSKFSMDGLNFTSTNKFNNLDSGTYKVFAISKEGCVLTEQSVRIMAIKVDYIFRNESITICEGEQYKGRKSSGMYYDTILSKTSCDTVKTLALSVIKQSKDSLGISICKGSEFAGYSNEGTYIDTLKTSTGCKYVRIINLHIQNPVFTNENKEICEGQVYLGHAESGTYIDTFAASNGCDSIRSLSLKVNQKSFKNVNVSICEGKLIYGYSMPGFYRDTFVNARGCDSIRELNLTVNAVSKSKIQRVLCPGESFNGYVLDGIYIDTLKAKNGCDSIRTIEILNDPCMKVDLVFSNTFSPNADHLNDAFKPVVANGKHLLQTYELRIYNRWGELIFKTNNVDLGWDGTFNHKECPAGTYMWVCNYRYAKGVKSNMVSESGLVNILR